MPRRPDPSLDLRPVRARCLRCHRPEAICICGLAPRVHNRTGIFILQHPRERQHALGTVPLARAALERVDVTVLGPKDVDAEAKATRLRARLPPGTALLYPTADAPDLEALAETDRPPHLLLLDGTWHHAKVYFRDLPWLRDLPRVKICPAMPGQYRVRREPRADCLSTVEAIAAALRVVEPDTPGVAGLLDAFRQMIDGVVERKGGVARFKRRPSRMSHPLH